MRSKPVGPALAVLFLVNVLNFYDRQALNAVLEPLRREFSLSDTQLGGLVTLFTVVFAVAGLPLGKLADTHSRRRLLAGGIAVWTGLTALASQASSYAMLLGTRLGVGIGEAVCTPAATSWIGDLVPPQRRARAMAIFMMAVPVGGMLSFAIGGPVAQAFGWRAALLLAAIPGLALAPAVLWLREPDRTVTAIEEHQRLILPPNFWWIAASGAVVNFALYSFSTFLPAFLTRYHGMTVAQAGVWSGIGTGVSGILGASIAATAGDRVSNRLWLAAAASLVAAGPIFGAIRMPAGSAAAAVWLAMTGYGLLQMYYGLVYAAIQDIVPPGNRGRAMAAYFVVTYLGGASWGPLATGRLSDFLAHRSGLGGEAARAIGLHHAMYVVPALAVVLAAVLWVAGRPSTLAHAD
uniref:Major facilitator superfamily MFS_1 n=1 Tax=Solibacter usitatus (strain Ellin6076) TaxID=234267 RepID=Q02AY5_SOLUE